MSVVAGIYEMAVLVGRPWDGGGSTIGNLLDVFDLLNRGRPAWHRQAACREHPEGDWFACEGDRCETAKQICAGCPVCGACGAWALHQDASLDGTWGGLTQADRRRLRRQAGVRKRAPAP